MALRVGIDIPYFGSPAEIREYCQAVEGIGYDHLGFSEHVCTTVDSAFPSPVIRFDDPWRETSTTAAFVAAVTSRVEINPAMMLLPLYHPVLAAKQLAELDNLAGGRLRVAASIGWNERETESLGVDPATRGARFEEQLAVIRALWAEPVVDHDGRFFQLRQVSINPRPPRPIPMWMGAGRMQANGIPSDASLRRVARVADGFKFAAPSFFERDQVATTIDRLRATVAAAGRDADAFPIEVRMVSQATTPADWPGVVRWAAGLGVSHLGISTRIAGGTVDDQIERARAFAETAFPAR